MTGRERGFLLLRSRLGDPARRPLTQAQLRELRQRVIHSSLSWEDRELMPEDILALGYDGAYADRIQNLLSDDALLDRYLLRAARQGCVPVTRVSESYPGRVWMCLGGEAPGTLWAKGDLSLLQMDKVALVGSRDLSIQGAVFASKVGEYAARCGFALVSGNARGADRVAQEACLEWGGKVIAVVADRLDSQQPRENVLYLAEEDFDGEFSPQRALSRNRIIHSLGNTTFVAQCAYRKGGTWDGSEHNLKNGWSTLRCLRDGSEAMKALEEMGAELIDIKDLSNR